MGYLVSYYPGYMFITLPRVDLNPLPFFLSLFLSSYVIPKVFFPSDCGIILKKNVCFLLLLSFYFIIYLK
jgi:hypothetical protein